MHWMQHTHLPAARRSVLMRATAVLYRRTPKMRQFVAADRCGVHFVADGDGPVAKVLPAIR
jgi:hypothetical protein